MPDEPEPLALLALMRLHDSRRGGAGRAGRPARAARRPGPHAHGTARRSPRALALTERALALGDRGRYALQAVIAAEHARAATAADTDWAAIARAYERLAPDRPEPGDRAQPRGGRGDGERPGGRPGARRRAGAPRSTRYHLLHATRADLLRRLGRVDEARAAYERALELAAVPVERDFLRGGSPSWGQRRAGRGRERRPPPATVSLHSRPPPDRPERNRRSPTVSLHSLPSRGVLEGNRHGRQTHFLTQPP